MLIILLITLPFFAMLCFRHAAAACYAAACYGYAALPFIISRR